MIRYASPLVPSVIRMTLFAMTPLFAQTHDIGAIQTLKCLTNDTVVVGAPFPAGLRALCNGGDSTFRAADTAIEGDNFRITYNPYGNLEAVDGDAECVGTCLGGRYERHPSPDQDYKNVRASEGGRQFLDTTTLIRGEDIVVHLPKGFNGPRENAVGAVNGAGVRDVVVMLHGGGGLGEAALSQLANIHSIQDLGAGGPVLLIPNAGNSLRMDSHQWAWDSWNTGCQTLDTLRMGATTPVRFRDFGSQNPADPFDDGFDDACASDLRRLLKLVLDLKTQNKWVRRVVLAGFSSGGHMTKTVMCTYPGAYDGYALFEHGDLIGAPGQNLCGNLDQDGAGYSGFLSRRLDSLVGARPQDLAANKRPLFQVCSDQDDACSDDLGAVWRIRSGRSDSLITDRALERQAYDHTEVTDRVRENIALVRVPDSAALSTLGRGQFDWKLAGLEFRAQTTLASNLPASVASMIAPNTLPPVCSELRGPAGPAAYDTDLCLYPDANAGAGPQAENDAAFYTLIAANRAGESVVSPAEDIVAVRYVEKRNGGAYGYIEVHGGGHTVHGQNLRNDFGKTRDFDTFVELVKFMRYAVSEPVSVRETAGPGAPRRVPAAKRVAGTVRFGERNALGRK